ncbi:MAG: pitrilysin family protein [Bryobacteraceae bacterium]
MSISHSTEGIQLTTLPNGVAVISEQMPHVRSVAVGVWVNAGSRNEGIPQNGISHFIEHMLFKGTENRSAEDIARQVDSIGGHLDAFTSKELVCFNAKTLDEHLPQGFDILSDLVLNPLFREDDIEKEKGVILEELKMEVDNPEYTVHDLFSSSIWKNHALGRPILGSKKSIRSFTADTLRQYYSHMYAPSRIVITAAGNLTHEQLLKLSEERFGKLAPSNGHVAVESPVPHAAVTLKTKRSLEQVHLCMGVPCNALPHPDRFAAYILNTVLGAGMSSRLFQNIREKRGLAYTVGSEQFLYRDSGCLSVFAGTSVESAKEVVELVLREFRELKAKQVTEEELKRAKDNLKGSFMLGLESTVNRMSHLARQYIYFKQFSTMDGIIADIEGVRAEQLQAMANEFFVQDRINLTMLGRLNGMKLTREDLVC